MRPKILLVLAGIVAFGAGLAGSFQFDDFALFSDPSIVSPSGWIDCWRLTQTRPLTWFSFWANYQLAGENAWAYHAVNLALHLGIVLLLFDILKRLLSPGTAFLAAVLFAVHPVLTEPVNYIFARATLFAALFSLLAIRSWIRERPWMTLLWFTLAMLGKEEAAALPLVLLLLRRPVFPKPAFKAAWAALLGVDLILGVRVLWAASEIGSGAGLQAGISPLQYLIAQFTVIPLYLQRIVIPWGFSVEYGAPHFSLLTAGALLLIGWALSRAEARAAVFFLAGLILLLPSSSLLPAADLAADRRMYLPMAAFCACAALVLQKWNRYFLAGIVALLIGISIRYTHLWKSPETLWTEAMLRAPEKIRPRLQLARAVAGPHAIALLAEAEELAPNDPGVAAEQGRLYLSQDRPREALAAFGRALALYPDDPGFLSNRGAALLALGFKDAARADFENALAKDVCLFDAWFNLRRMEVGKRPPEDCRFTPQQKKLLSGD